MKKLRHGFSLIEVNMAILVVAGGILSLFALFPASLRMSNMALADMRQSMFADEVFTRIKANAAEIDDLEIWTDKDRFWAAISRGSGTHTIWTEMGRSVNPTCPAVAPQLTKDQSSSSLNSKNPNQWYFMNTEKRTAELPAYFASRSGHVSAPARFIVRLHRINPSTVWQKETEGLNRMIPGGRDLQLDFLTWRISLVVSDQPDVVFDENPTYHIEVRYQGK